MGASEKHDATYHGGEFTPRTEAIRDQFIDRRGEPGNESWNEGAALRFDRWLETVRAEAKAEAVAAWQLVIATARAEAWEEGLRLGVGGHPPHTTAILFKANPYK